MQQNSNYLASSSIEQFDLITIDTSSTDALAIYCKPASSDDVIIGRANGRASAGDMVTFTELVCGVSMSLIAGENLSAGDFLAASSGKAVKGDTHLMAIEAASSGAKFRAMLVEEEVEIPEPPEPVAPFDPLSMVPEYNAQSGYKPTLAVGDLVMLGWGDLTSALYPGQETTGDKTHTVVLDSASITIGGVAYKLLQVSDFGNQYSEGYKFKVITGAPARGSSADEYTPFLAMVSAVPSGT